MPYAGTSAASSPRAPRQPSGVPVSAGANIQCRAAIAEAATAVRSRPPERGCARSTSCRPSRSASSARTAPAKRPWSTSVSPGVRPLRMFQVAIRRPTVPPAGGPAGGRSLARCACSWPWSRPTTCSTTSTSSSSPSRRRPTSAGRQRDQLHVTLAFLADVAGPRARRTEGRGAAGAGGRAAYGLPGHARGRWGLPGRRPGPGDLDRVSTSTRPAAPSCPGWRRVPAPPRTRPGSRWTGRPSSHTSRWPGSRSRGRPRRWVRLLDAYRGPTWTVDRIELVASSPRRGSAQAAAVRAPGVLRPAQVTMGRAHPGRPRVVASVLRDGLLRRATSPSRHRIAAGRTLLSPSRDARPDAAVAGGTVPQDSGGSWCPPRRRTTPAARRPRSSPFRIVCDEECVGTLETEGGLIRTVRWDGDRLLVELPEEETGVGAVLRRGPAAGAGLGDDDRPAYRRARAGRLGTRRGRACRPGSRVPTTRRSGSRTSRAAAGSRRRSTVAGRGPWSRWTPHPRQGEA